MLDGTPLATVDLPLQDDGRPHEALLRLPAA